MKDLIYYYAATFLKVLMVFFSPIKGIIMLVALSTIIDTAVGIWKARKLKEKITSKKARFGFVPKLISYVGAIMLVYMSDYFIISELIGSVISIDFFATKVIALALISVEVKSIDESFKAVKGCSFLEKITGLILKMKDIKKHI